MKLEELKEFLRNKDSILVEEEAIKDIEFGITEAIAKRVSQDANKAGVPLIFRGVSRTAFIWLNSECPTKPFKIKKKTDPTGLLVVENENKEKEYLEKIPGKYQIGDSPKFITTRHFSSPHYIFQSVM